MSKNILEALQMSERILGWRPECQAEIWTWNHGHVQMSEKTSGKMYGNVWSTFANVWEMSDGLLQMFVTSFIVTLTYLTLVLILYLTALVHFWIPLCAVVHRLSRRRSRTLLRQAPSSLNVFKCTRVCVCVCICLHVCAYVCE